MRQGGAIRSGLSFSPGMRVGLYGGSFDPPHAGHAHVARTALRRLNLDRVVWLVSPQNPLKAAPPANGWSSRLLHVEHHAWGPSMLVSDFEGRVAARYTIETIRALKFRFRGVHFVWIMGADGLAAFHRWRDWTSIMREIPIAVVARPHVGLKSRFSPAARRFARARRPLSAASRLAVARPPAWVYLDAPLSGASSTAIRAGRRSSVI